MMICPQCGTQYGDDGLRYCLQDGTPLTPGSVTGAPTVELGDAETVVSPSRSRQVSPQPYPEERKASVLPAVLLTILGMLVLFGVVGGGIWLYLRNGQGDTGKNNGNFGSQNSAPNRNSNLKNTLAKNAANSGANSQNSAAVRPQNVNVDEIRREVAKTIMTWRSMAESRDLDSYMDNYADTADYYLKKGASKAFIRSDKQKAFTMFDKIKLEIDDFDITVAPSGDEATAQFDKEWEFEGEKTSKGKVRQELKLKLANGAWLITSEKDLQELK
jgi:ketosteroid isomerase-like protein